MDFSINKEHTTITNYGNFRALLKKIRSNRAMLEDMKVCLQGIQKLRGEYLYAPEVKLLKLELLGITDEAQFCLSAEVEGWMAGEERVKNIIAKLRIWGTITDGGEYFQWDKTEENGAPAEFNVRLYAEELDPND